MLPEKNAEAYCRELEEADGTPAWIVGRVVAASTPAEARTARLVSLEHLQVLEVPHEAMVVTN